MIEPIYIPAGDTRVLLNGVPPKFPCRVLSEDTYQELISNQREYIRECEHGRTGICTECE